MSDNYKLLRLLYEEADRMGWGCKHWQCHDFDSRGTRNRLGIFKGIEGDGINDERRDNPPRGQKLRLSYCLPCAFNTLDSRFIEGV